MKIREKLNQNSENECIKTFNIKNDSMRHYFTLVCVCCLATMSIKRINKKRTRLVKAEIITYDDNFPLLFSPVSVAR